jgi:hypothetical protein
MGRNKKTEMVRCNQCGGGDKKQDVVGEHVETERDPVEEYAIWYTYQIVKCCGCGVARSAISRRSATCSRHMTPTGRNAGRSTNGSVSALPPSIRQAPVPKRPPRNVANPPVDPSDRSGTIGRRPSSSSYGISGGTGWPGKVLSQAFATRSINGSLRGYLSRTPIMARL